MNSQRILVVGATSAIAQVAIRLWAGQGASLFLVGRHGERLAMVAADVEARGGKAKVAVMDNINGEKSMATAVDAALNVWGGLDGVLIAHGWLPEGSEVQDNPLLVAEVLRVNGESVCKFLSILAPHFEQKKAGWLAVISSVAGERGRTNLYVYGAAKALVSHFVSGLRHRLAGSGVRVIDIRPGTVDTPMTAGKKLPFPATAERVGMGVVKACATANGVVYLPWFWRYIMLIIRHIPEFVWLKMKL